MFNDSLKITVESCDKIIYIRNKIRAKLYGVSPTQKRDELFSRFFLFLFAFFGLCFFEPLSLFYFAKNNHFDLFCCCFVEII